MIQALVRKSELQAKSRSYRPEVEAQIKHINNFSIKNFGPLRPPPPKKKTILYVWAFFLYFEGKEAPNIKNLRGQGSLRRGRSRRGVSGEILYVYALFFGA